MSTKTASIQGKMQKIAGKISSNKYLKAVSDGLVSTIPALIVGAIATLLAGLPVDAYQSFLESTGLKSIINKPYEVTTNVLAIYAVFFIAYHLAGALKTDQRGAGLIALVSFLVLTPIQVVEGSNVLPFNFLGAQGLFVAIIVGLLTAKFHAIIEGHGWTIKLPDGVPPTISKSFESLIPGFVIIIFWTVVMALFELTPMGSFHQFIYTFVQAPLNNIGGSFWSVIIITLLIHLFWLFGVHGVLVVLPVIISVWTPLGIENLEAMGSGEPLPHIVSMDFLTAFILIGGSGATLGLACLMAFAAKSKRYKTLGKLTVVPSFFGINEPIIFGTPIILNPYLAVPFILAPLAGAIVSYAVMAIDLFPRVYSIGAPLGTPVIANAFLNGGFMLVLLQIIVFIITTLIYYPFFRIVDKKALAEEQGTAEEQGAAEEQEAAN